jgi:hypothetical protein
MRPISMFILPDTSYFFFISGGVMFCRRFQVLRNTDQKPQNPPAPHPVPEVWSFL